MKIVSTNPAKNYEKIGEVEASSVLQIREKVKKANASKQLWKELGVRKRIELLKPVTKIIERRKNELALLITKEIGKPIKESLADIEWDFSYLRDFFNNGEKYLSEEITFKDKDIVHKVVYEPTGVAAVIVPWNFPLDMFLWGVIPNLIVGNTVVFKHSEECILTGKLIEEIMADLDLPEGVFDEVYGNGSVGEQLVDQDIDLIWFTGSSRVGKTLYQIASKKFVKAILEMGGSNPAIIFDDVDIEGMINKLYVKRFLNCGQACDAVKRLIVKDSVFEEVVGKLKKVIEGKKVGDPEKKETDVGSLAARRQLELLESQVKDAINKGAKVVVGGKRPANFQGAYYMPTLLTNIKTNMRVWKEEVFGPVLSIISFKTEKQAIELANDTIYGLGAEIYSEDKARALRVASQIEAGNININQGNHWIACNPFGGYKQSGMGREHGKWGFQELCQIKNIALA